MKCSNVCSDVGRFLRDIMTMRTTKSRQLLTLEFQMCLQIVLTIEHTATFRTGKDVYGHWIISLHAHPPSDIRFVEIQICNQKLKQKHP